MIIVTGAAGFIGSRLIARLNREKFYAIVAVDDFSNPVKNRNLEDLKVLEKVERTVFFNWLDQNYREAEFIFHIGARTDTTEFNRELLFSLNTEYTKVVWKKCVMYQVPLVYASSAATYGLGELGYKDDESVIPGLKPLNPYGESKNNFDSWAISQIDKPFFWAGLKFFNVYGPHEDHKGRMASVVWHTFRQIRESGTMKLFRSHNPVYRDGEQKRDFIYVNDITDVCYFLMHHRKNSGIYNVGTGKARTFRDLAGSVFKAMDLPEKIRFIDTPEDIRDKYQYFTQAEMSKLRSIGYNAPFTELERGVEEYVKNYLLNH
jgi:ADP-L-glycero-D-manno-heptose 6-epimerase